MIMEVSFNLIAIGILLFVDPFFVGLGCTAGKTCYKYSANKSGIKGVNYLFLCVGENVPIYNRLKAI